MIQFDFKKEWKLIKSLLSKKDINLALYSGMSLLDKTYKFGDCPAYFGNITGDIIRKNNLSWYRPYGKCHYIAPFVLAIAKEIFPNYKTGIISGIDHTLVVVFEDKWTQPEIVMDILLFDDKEAKESLDFAIKKAKFYPTITKYIASFSKSPKDSYKIIKELFPKNF